MNEKILIRLHTVEFILLHRENRDSPIKEVPMIGQKLEETDTSVTVEYFDHWVKEKKIIVLEK